VADRSIAVVKAQPFKIGGRVGLHQLLGGDAIDIRIALKAASITVTPAIPPIMRLQINETAANTTRLGLLDQTPWRWRIVVSQQSSCSVGLSHRRLIRQASGRNAAFQ